MRHRLSTCLVLSGALAAAAIGARLFASAASSIVFDIPGRPDSTPSVAASGSFVAIAWGAGAGGKADVFLAVSRDGGATFASPVQVNTIAGEARLGGELPPRVAVAPGSGRAAPEIAVLWTARGAATEIKVARSTDGGRTFGQPSTLQSAGAAGDRGWPALALDRQARIHAIWLDHRGLAAAVTGHADHKSGGPRDGVAMAQRSGLYYASRSTKPQQERQLAAGVCYCCKTALAAGPGGAVYAAWRHVYPGNMRDMAFAVSRDSGRTFSPPVRVSEDAWAVNGCPDDGPAIAVDNSGVVHLAWATVINGSAPEGAIVYASTRDGRRFTPRVRVPTLGSPKPSHPQIAVDRRGRIFVAWDENVDGKRVAAMRELRIAAGRDAAFGNVVMLSPDGTSTYPAIAATDKALVAVWATGGEQSRVEARIVDE
jgi:hypothetical protein